MKCIHYILVLVTILWSSLSHAQKPKCTSLSGDTVINLTQQVSIYIDQAPFATNSDISKQSYSSYSEVVSLDYDFNQKNTVGWLRLRLCATPDADMVEGSIFFGKFSRLMVYSEKDEIDKFPTMLGDLYKNKIVPTSVNRWLLPVQLVSDHETTLYIYAADSYPNKFDIDKLDVHFIPKGQEEEFLNYSRFRLLGGFIHVGLIFLISFLIGICTLFLLLHKDYRLLSFGMVCTAALLYYLRDMEVYFESSIFWSHLDEGPLRVETLLRGSIAASFIAFVLVNFNFGKWYKTICITSSIAVLLSISLGVWHIYHIGPFAVATSFESTLALIDIFVTLLNSLFILGLLWKQNEPYGRNLVVAIFTFIAFSYCGLLLNNTSIGQLDSLLSSKMYSTYGMIIFLFYIGLFTFRRSYSTQKDYLRQSLKAEQLEELSEVKTRLYTNITHEFRTPLTVIMGVADNMAGAEKEKSIIKRNGQQLLDLVNEMLLLSKADAGSLNLNLQQSDIIPFLDYITESFLSLAEKKNIRLLLYSDEQNVVMDFDKEKIKMITVNLLSNAVRYTPIGGKVIMILSVKENCLIWKVKDSGIGIREEDIPHIFERFYQSKSSSTSTAQGTGIGLAIVKELVTLSNGVIEVDSQLGQGTTFIISLPITNNAPLATSVSKIQNKKKKTATIVQNEQHLSVGPQDIVVLVVEDNDDVRDYICKSMPDDYTIIEAVDGEIGIERAIAVIPDIIISDVMMPIKDGYQLTQVLKADERTNHIPIILLTAKATQNEKVEGLRYGADAYIIKPFDKDELLVRIEKLMDLRIKLQERYKSERTAERKRLPDWLLKLESILSEHIADETTVEWVSKKMFMSRTQLHRKLSSLVGMSASQFIKEFKLRAAKEMLLTTEDSIGAIALNIGYKNPGHFATDFKKKYGQTPSVFRQKA